MDYWYGLTIYVPKEFESPTNRDAVVFQFHAQAGGPSPILAIRIKDNEWLITCDATEKCGRSAFLPVDRDRWTDWVVHTRLSADPHGFRTIWKDGVEVVNERDIVTQFPEELGPYAKFGQYHSVDEASQNILFFDEYRVAGSDGSYTAVSPAGAAASKP
jgi:hypothetical protein